MSEQLSPPSSDECLLAAISHFLGLLAALIVWVTQKDKSRFVRFQSIQAMAFDLIVSAIMFLAIGVIIVIIFGVLALGISDIAVFGSQGNPMAEPIRTMIALMTAMPFLIASIFIPIAVLIFVARMIATIQTFQGKDFHYPWLGAIVKRSMGF